MSHCCECCAKKAKKAKSQKVVKKGTTVDLALARLAHKNKLNG
jgi:hypothetical protein